MNKERVKAIFHEARTGITHAFIDGDIEHQQAEDDFALVERLEERILAELESE